MISAGVESGAKNTKAVIMEAGRILGKGLVPTGFDQEKAVEEAFAKALAAAGLKHEAVGRIAVTGSGKDFVTMADLAINDIKAMARAGTFLFSGAGTVVDVGSEEGRAARLDKEGNVIDFAVNEKCAAGAGSFIEAMARALELDLSEMGPLALTSDKAIPMNAQCVVFAESEVVGLIHGRTEKKDIAKAIHDAMASRIVAMIRRIGVGKDLVIMGGVGRNPAFIAAVKRELDLDKIHVPEEPEFGPALGAALVAGEGGERA